MSEPAPAGTAAPDEPRGELMIRIATMPAEANSGGNIFGGWLVSQLDQGAGLIAARRARGQTTTVAIDQVRLLAPVIVGDEYSVYGELVQVGSTSLQVRVEGWRRQRHSDERFKATEGLFTFVAIDGQGRPRPVDEE